MSRPLQTCAIVIFLFLPTTIAGLDETSMKFSIDYFSHRDVKLMCLLTCEGAFLNRNFVKQASRHFISVAVVKISDDSFSTMRISTCLEQKYSSIGVLVDLGCPRFDDIMYHASFNTLLDSKHKWLILNDYINTYQTNSSVDMKAEENNIDIPNVIGELNISVDTDIYLAMPQGDGLYELYELYNFGKVQGGDLIIEKSASWSSETGFSFNLNGYKYYRRWNFYQWPMRMISVMSPAPNVFDPKILTDRNPTPGIATITKTGATIIEVIAEIHNMRFIHSIAERWLSDFSLNQSKAVVASSLYYRNQDVSPGIRFMKEVHDKVDLVHPPLTSIETRYYYRIPTHGAGKLENQFLQPLSPGAWVAVLMVMALCALVLLLSASLERRPSSAQYAVFSVIASICQQFFDENTAHIRRVSAARELTILVTGISCVLIYNYYTSSVVSWLLNGPPPSINSLQELLESPLNLIYEDIGYTRSWLQTPNYYYNRRNTEIEDELRKKKVFNKKKDAPLMMSVEDGIKMVKAGGFAFHTEVDNANRLIGRTFTQSELCELGSLQSMEKTLLYPCMQKNSPYKEFFVWSLARLLERGIVKCIQLRTVSRSVQCEGSSPRALALGGAAPAFLLLAGGYFMATIIMLAERAIWRYKQNPEVLIRKIKSRKLM